MSTFQPGDTVVVASRPQTSADIASHLYYPHYAGLSGTILKVYGEEAAVLVDRSSLPSPILTRHEQNEKHQRQRWLDSLSDEARNKLSASEKQFALNYAILVSVKDLGAGTASASDDAPTRKTAKELEDAEAEFLASRQNG
jgi:hypothetical protein